MAAAVTVAGGTMHDIAPIAASRGRPSEAPAPGEPALISICIPSYNRAHLVGESVDSALAQTWPHFEVIIVDDGSTDETADIVARYVAADPRVHYEKKPQNSGRSDTRNRCVALASGEYVLWLADDDVLAPDALEHYVAELDADPGLDVVYGNLQLWESGSDEKLDPFEAQDWTGREAEMPGAFLRGSVVPDGGSIIRRRLYAECGNYDREFVRAQDYEFWTRVAGRARFKKIDHTVYFYRKHDSNVSFGRFVDLSYDSKIIRRHLARHSLEVLFPELDWRRPDDARPVCWLKVARALENYKDWVNIVRFIAAIPGWFRWPEAVERMGDALIGMGDLEALARMIDEYEAWSPRRSVMARSLAEKLAFVCEARADIDAALARGDVVAAQTTINAIGERFSTIFDFVHGASRAYAMTGEARTAMRYAEQALRADPRRDDLLEHVLSFGDLAGVPNSHRRIFAMRERLTRTYVELDAPGARPATPPDIPRDGPLVSIVMTTEGADPAFRAAVKTAIAQEYGSVEIVIGDRGHARSSWHVDDDRVRWVDCGGASPAAARNAAVAAAGGEYIAHLCADGAFYVDHIALLVHALREQDASVAYAAAWIADLEDIDGRPWATLRGVGFADSFEPDRLLVDPIIALGTVVQTRKSYIDAGGLTDGVGFAEWDLLVRLTADHTFAHVERVTGELTLPPEPGDVVARRRARLEFYRRHEARWMLRESVRDALVDRLRPLGVVPVRRGTTSVIVVGGEDPEQLRDSVRHLLAHTRVPIDVIVIADAEAAANPLGPLGDAHPRIRGQRSRRSCTLAKRFNQGLALSDSEYIAVLSADVRVEDDWLGRLQWWAEQAPDRGIVCAVEGAPRPEAEPMAARPARAACALIKRGVLDRVGGIDRVLGAGVYDFHDWHLRVTLAGYTVVEAPDVAVRREGPPLVVEAGDPSRFAARWGFDPRPDGEYGSDWACDHVFDRARHFVNIGAEEGFRPDIPPIEIVEARSRKLLLVPPTDDEALRGLVGALSDLDAADASVLLRAEPGSGEWLRQRLCRLGDSERLPDLLLLDTRLAPDREAGVYVAANAVYVDDAWPESDSVARRAADCGVPVLRGRPALERWFGAE